MVSGTQRLPAEGISPGHEDTALVMEHHSSVAAVKWHDQEQLREGRQFSVA